MISINLDRTVYERNKCVKFGYEGIIYSVGHSTLLPAKLCFEMTSNTSSLHCIFVLQFLLITPTHILLPVLFELFSWKGISCVKLGNISVVFIVIEFFRKMDFCLHFLCVTMGIESFFLLCLTTVFCIDPI